MSVPLIALLTQCLLDLIQVLLLKKISVRITPLAVPSPSLNLDQEKVAHSIFSAF